MKVVLVLEDYIRLYSEISFYPPVYALYKKFGCLETSEEALREKGITLFLTETSEEMNWCLFNNLLIGTRGLEKVPGVCCFNDHIHIEKC